MFNFVFIYLYLYGWYVRVSSLVSRNGEWTMTSGVVKDV